MTTSCRPALAGHTDALPAATGPISGLGDGPEYDSLHSLRIGSDTQRLAVIN